MSNRSNAFFCALNACSIIQISFLKQELPEQVVIFLEKLLERGTLSHTTLRQLNKCYIFSSGNAEVCFAEAYNYQLNACSLCITIRLVQEMRHFRWSVSFTLYLFPGYIITELTTFDGNFVLGVRSRIVFDSRLLFLRSKRRDWKYP